MKEVMIEESCSAIQVNIHKVLPLNFDTDEIHFSRSQFEVFSIKRNTTKWLSLSFFKNSDSESHNQRLLTCTCYVFQNKIFNSGLYVSRVGSSHGCTCAESLARQVRFLLNPLCSCTCAVQQNLTC